MVLYHVVSEYTTCQGGCSGTPFFCNERQYTEQSADIQAEQLLVNRSELQHYALLINGKWGSGKTYFVRETLIPHIKESDHDVNYLSLYGIRSTDEISRMLCVQAIKNKVPVLESKGSQIATKVLSSIFKGGMNMIGVGDTGIEGVS